MTVNNDWDSEVRLILPVLTSEEKARIDMIDRRPWEAPVIQSRSDLASFIDHTLLAPDATASEIITVCDEAVKWTTGAVCINPIYVPLAHQTLGSSPTDIASVVAFPLGASPSASKAFEAGWAVGNGATEIDMVLAVGLLKSQQWRAVLDDIEAVRAVCPSSVQLKVILENVLLTDHEIVQACLLCVAAGADFVKTSTGFSKGGATLADVALMRQVVGLSTGVKASGGIHSAEDALAMIQAGADRIGASQTEAILEGFDVLLEGK